MGSTCMHAGEINRDYDPGPQQGQLHLLQQPPHYAHGGYPYPDDARNRGDGVDDDAPKRRISSQYDALRYAEQYTNKRENALLVPVPADDESTEIASSSYASRSQPSDVKADLGGRTVFAVMPDKGDLSSLGDEVPYMLQSLDHRKVEVHAAQSEKLNEYSILAKVDVSRKLRFVEIARQNEILDRAMGSMCGMGIGDAMGHMFEFLPAQDTPGRTYFALKNFKFYGEQNTFSLQYGQWTDDASMGLCMADSLILRREYDGGDMRARFWCWWHRGYNNAFRLDRDRWRSGSVGLGGNISKSLDDMSRLSKGRKPDPVFNARGEDAGNGSLMRFTPVPIFFHAASDEDLYEYARKSSYTTHPGIVAAEACAFLAHLIKSALKRRPGELDVKRFLEEASDEYLQTSGLQNRSGWGYDEMKWLVSARPERDTERCWCWRDESLDIAATLRARGDTYNGYPVSAGYFGSYSLDGLAMALWAVYHTTSFNEAIAKSINLCGDADSHGSIAGQLAGALYGYSTIDSRFLKWLNRWDEHEFAVRAVLLYELGSQWARR